MANPNTPSTPAKQAAPKAEAPAAPKATDPSVEAPAAESTKSEATEAKDEGPAPEAVLRDAVNQALANADAKTGKLVEADVESLAAAYRKVPAAKRGQVQAEILREAMTTDGVNMQAMAEVLEQMTKAPAKATATRKARVQLPAEQVAAQAIATLRIAEQTILSELENDELRATATKLVTERIAAPISDEDERNSFLRGVVKVIKASSPKASKGSGGGSTGPRAGFKDDLAAIVKRGDLKDGDVLKHGDVEATIKGDKIVWNGSEYENPTAAATAVLKSQDKSTSVNGWAWWSVVKGDKSVLIGDLRTPAA